MNLHILWSDLRILCVWHSIVVYFQVCGWGQCRSCFSISCWDCNYTQLNCQHYTQSPNTSNCADCKYFLSCLVICNEFTGLPVITFKCLNILLIFWDVTFWVFHCPAELSTWTPCFTVFSQCSSCHFFCLRSCLNILLISGM